MRFGKDTLFEDVSVKFTPGNRYGLIGANGSGKSTFMKILTGQLESSQGEVFIGKDCVLGYLHQDHMVFDECPILDTVYMGNKELWDLHCEREELYSKDDLTDAENEQLQAHTAPEISNSRGLIVGEIRAAPSWLRG